RPSADPHPRVAEHAHPRRIAAVGHIGAATVRGAPARGRPGHHDISRDTLGMRHQDRITPIRGGYAGDTARTAIRVIRILPGRPAMMIDIAQGGNGPGWITLALEVGVTLAMRNGHGHD